MPTNQNIQSQFSADAPVTNPVHDAFYRHPFAVRISDMIRERSDPSSAVIGIYGAWGEGKSTVLEFAKRELGADTKILLMPFNPWRFGGDEQLLWAFFATLSDTLKSPLKTKAEKVAGWLAEYGEIVIPKVEFGYGAASVSGGENVAKLAERFATLNPEKARERIEEALLNAKKRVVVIMDDIDRLDSDEIHQVFKLVKLTANFPYVDYLLAFDHQVVADSLGRRYGGNAATGLAFLEKIVQVPLPLPAASESSLRTFCFRIVDQVLNDSKISLSVEEARTFASEFDDTILPFLKTPRMAWRYSNAIRFGLPAIKDEANAVDFMLLEGARLFLPSIYEILNEHGLRVIQSHDLSKDTAVITKITEALEKLPKDEKDSGTDFLRFMLPQLQSVIGSNGFFGRMSYSDGSYEQWAKHRRLCVKDYFARYFALAVSPDDFSELSISLLLLESASGPEAAISWLDQNATPAKAEALLRKVYRRIEEMDEKAVTSICLAFAARGGLFTDAAQMMSFSTSVSATRFLWQAISTKVSKGDQSKLALRLISEATPIYFALDCLWIFRPSKTENDRGLISERQTQQSQRQIAKRALDEFQNIIPWETYPDSFVRILLCISQASGRGQTEKYLLGLFKTQPDGVLDFLMHSTGKSYPLQTGIPHPQDFEGRHLKTLEKIISPKRIYTLVKKQVGNRLKIGDRFSSHKFEGRERTAAEFLYVYESAAKTTKATQNTENSLTDDSED